MSRFRPRGAALALLAILPATAARAAADVPLAAQHAAYDLALDTTEGGATIAASGTMTYKVIDACANWATQQQLRMHTVTRDGEANDLVSNYATLEAKDGHRLSFDMTQISNGVMAEQLRGEATTDADGNGRVRYTEPRRMIVMLPHGTLFPMAHTAAIIRAARTGAKSLSLPLFDGTGADGAQDTYITILRWHGPPSASAYPELAGLGSSRDDIAFFARTPQTITPDYESSMRYFDNGVADRLLMNFGGFTMKGTLRTLTIPKRPGRC